MAIFCRGPDGGVECRGYKKWRFSSTNISRLPGNDTIKIEDRTIELEEETIPKLSNSMPITSSDRVTRNADFKVTNL